MEYLQDRGAYADVPFETIKAVFLKTYAGLMSGKGLEGDFHAEAVAQAMDPSPPQSEEKAG
jgi:hypothetical protein